MCKLNKFLGNINSHRRAVNGIRKILRETAGSTPEVKDRPLRSQQLLREKREESPLLRVGNLIELSFVIRQVEDAMSSMLFGTRFPILLSIEVLVMA